MSNKDSSLNEDKEGWKTLESISNNKEKKETGINESQAGNIKFLMSELNEQLKKERKNSAKEHDNYIRAVAENQTQRRRAHEDYDRLEKQTIETINARENKIILRFLTVYEDFISAKNAYKKDGTNVDGLDAIIKTMRSILDNYEVKAIEAKGKKLDPKLHEVVREIEKDNLEEGTITEEITKGYIIRGEVCKPSRVCVSKKLIKK